MAVSKNAATAASGSSGQGRASGENRVQELIAKQTVLESEGLSPRWHLIGSLQTNKVRQVVGRTA